MYLHMHYHTQLSKFFLISDIMAFPNCSKFFEKLSKLPGAVLILYYTDLFSDIYLAIELFRACHYKYASFSLAIIFVSYVTIAILLKIRKLAPTWSSAFSYPYHLGQIHSNYIKSLYNCFVHDGQIPQMSEQHELYAHNVKYIEAVTESLQQLCLACLVGVESNFWDSKD